LPVSKESKNGLIK